MVVPLDSPRWNTLRHAYGPAGDVPALIRAIQTEETPNYCDGGTWFEVYSSLFHQHSTYSATFAALPHLVRIAETGTRWQRVAILCLAGEILVLGHADEEIPNDLIWSAKVGPSRRTAPGVAKEWLPSYGRTE